jgi:lipid-binding SYLF domain-containing protein
MKILALVIAGLAPLLTVSVSARADTAAVSERVAAAAGILRAKQRSANPIPPAVLAGARGVAIISVGRGGLIFGGLRGEGIVLARTRGALGPSWSAPVAFNMSGGSFGAQIGYEKVNYVFILNTDDAVRAFLSDDGVRWDAGVQGTAGPGSAAAAGDPAKPAVYIYTQADGVYGGATVGGVTLRLDRDANRRAYGAEFGARDLINGQGQRPQSAAKLYELLNGDPADAEE